MICELCCRDVDKTTEHHLIPKTRHKNKKNKSLFDRKDVKERKANLCNPCHNKVHSILTEKELEINYNTVSAIKKHPDIIKFVKWISKKQIQRLSSRKKNV